MATARAVFQSWRTTSMTSVSWRLTGLFGTVAPLHVVGWEALAYASGLLHPFDARHISAIDNTTRKRLQEGKKPLGVGFFFSLGRSTVVFLIALALGLATQFVVTNVVSANGQLKN